MAKIGLVPMAAKPYHSGHDALVRLAARENDVVHLYASTNDRINISGEGMQRIWKELIEPTLPANVEVFYGGSPVGHVYTELGVANDKESPDVFTVYSDPIDAADNYKTLDRYAAFLLKNGQVRLRPVERTSTVDISGTQMRKWFDSGDRAAFVAHMPKGIGDSAWEILKANPPVPPPKKKKAGRKKPKSS